MTMNQADFRFVIDDKEWAEVIAMARRMAPEIGQKAVSKVIANGTNSILDSMKSYIGANAKSPTGNLARNLKPKRKKKYEPLFWHSSIAVNMGTERVDGAYYWQMVEDGHRVFTRKKVDTGKKVQPMKYAISAFELNKQSIISNFTSSVRSQLMKSWGRTKKGGA